MIKVHCKGVKCVGFTVCRGWGVGANAASVVCSVTAYAVASVAIYAGTN